MRPLIRKARRTQSPYKESEQNRQKPQWQEWNAIAAGVWELEAGQVEDIEGQESLGDEFEPFCAWPSERKSWRLCICHSGNPQEEADRKLEENHSGP